MSFSGSAAASLPVIGPSSPKESRPLKAGFLVRVELFALQME